MEQSAQIIEGYRMKQMLLTPSVTTIAITMTWEEWEITRPMARKFTPQNAQSVPFVVLSLLLTAILLGHY